MIELLSTLDFLKNNTLSMKNSAILTDLDKLNLPYCNKSSDDTSSKNILDEVDPDLNLLYYLNDNVQYQCKYYDSLKENNCLQKSSLSLLDFNIRSSQKNVCRIFKYFQ